MDAVKQHKTDKETKRIPTQLTQITFISAANCECLRVTQTREISWAGEEEKEGGHLCDITVSLTHPLGRRVGGQGTDP